MRHFFRRSFNEGLLFFCYLCCMEKKLIIIGKAASGKDFLQRQLVSNGWIPLRQYTTRPKRPTEVGDEYHFVSAEEFDSISKKLYSIQNFNGWRYGYDIDEALMSDVMIFSPANFFDLIMDNISDRRCGELLYHSIVVYLDIDEDTRRERLSIRYKGGKEDDSLERRLRADAEDFKPFDIIDWGSKPLGSFIRLCSKEEVDDFLKKLLS